MYSIARLSEQEKRILFRNTAQKSGFIEAIVEKDFWVCIMLDYLFHRCQWKNAFTFKGGTSLSKCYGLINRFSEDIDLILDWRVIGYGINEPWEDRSNTKQDHFNKEANTRAEIWLAEVLLPMLRADWSDILDTAPDFFIEPDDPQTICFRYPCIYQTDSILQVLRLEIGALAAWTPAVKKAVRPYAAEYYPKAFEQAETVILTAAAERTFWEKVTILHHEANRPAQLAMPMRYSRHYYDLFCIAHSDSKQSAFHDLALLQKVVDFKMKFYPRKWAQYEAAKPGSLQLCPPIERLEALRKDYEVMQDMMFGESPSFQELMDYIKQLENELNNL